MAKLDLQPRKVFVITLDDNTSYEGKFGTWALRRAGEKSGIKLSEIAEACKDTDKAFDLSIALVLAAIEYTARQQGKPFSLTDVHACGIIDELGGMNGELFTKLIAHSGDEEKKSETGITSTGPISSVSFAPAEVA